MNMDVVYWPRKDPVRVLMVNPLRPSSEITIVRILSGSAFGMKQLVDMTLLVYSNEITRAQGFIQELLGCNFGCLNTIVATSDLPSLADADVFCFMSDFKNPTILDDADDLETDNNFDTIYLTLKVALSLGKSSPAFLKQKKESGKEMKYPIFITDGLVIMDMIYSMGNIDIPSYCYFCNATLPALARTVLSELLQVQSYEINNTYVWGVNDRTFHIEIDKPFVIYDTIKDKAYCDWEMVSNELLQPLKLDHTQFNASWMKKEFIEKLKNLSSRNPYGEIFRGWKLARCLWKVWSSTRDGQQHFHSLGIISDGSLRTAKGLPYYLPLVFDKNSVKWKVDERFGELPHVKQEIEKFNKVAKVNHERLVRYCTKFIEENIIKQSFIPQDGDDVDSTFSSSQISQKLA